MPFEFRIATYNVHKCRGLDRRTSPARIAKVLLEINADVIALQEIMHSPQHHNVGGDFEHDQLSRIALELNTQGKGSYQICFGENRRLKTGAPYGNAVLTRVPFRACENYHLPHVRRERRGCLRVDLALPGPRKSRLLHFFNVHLGTGPRERRSQGRNLLSQSILRHASLQGPRMIVGDFNEWISGTTTSLLRDEMQSVDLRLYSRRRRTYPGILPVLHLDHIYYDRGLELKDFRVHRSRTALLASDHLPLVADFRLEEAA